MNSKKKEKVKKRKVKEIKSEKKEGGKATNIEYFNEPFELPPI